MSTPRPVRPRCQVCSKRRRGWLLRYVSINGEPRRYVPMCHQCWLEWPTDEERAQRDLLGTELDDVEADDARGWR